MIMLQDASVTMRESRQRLRDESGFLPWGKVIVRHKCFNAIAKMRRSAASRRVAQDDRQARAAGRRRQNQMADEAR